MDYSTPGFPVLHQLPELAQTHIYQVSDAIQPSRLLSSPSPHVFNLSQHQGQLFSSGGLSTGASVLALGLKLGVQISQKISSYNKKVPAFIPKFHSKVYLSVESGENKVLNFSLAVEYVILYRIGSDLLIF